ncbi:hypothetical protein KCU92_g9345, partial [Aureobasidium melanogenum]|jgi:hypothetical protein
MADPQATALRSDSDYLLRIKTDTKELSSKQHEAQRKIDAIRAQTYREGPTAILEARMEDELAGQKSICMSDIAVSIIGASIEDLTRTSRKPPSVTAVRDVLGSIDYLDNEVSLESVRLVLVIRTGNTAESLTDVFEDLQCGHIKKLVINLQNKIEELFDDVRGLEDAVDGGGGHEGRRKSEQLSINRSSDSKKRSTSASDDETNIKRRCS